MRTLDTLIVAPLSAVRKRSARTPADQEALKKSEEEERQHRAKLTSSWKLLENHPKFAGVMLQILTQVRQLEDAMPEAALERLSEARMEHFMKKVDIHGSALVTLVGDLGSQKALVTIMNDVYRCAWWDISMLPVDIARLRDPFGKPTPIQLQLDRVRRRAQHWVLEGYGRVASASPVPIRESPEKTVAIETVAAQIDRLRQECRITAEKLAECLGCDPTTVYRHISGVMTPHLRILGAYERVFSKMLNRQVVINKTPVKRK